MTCLLVGVDCSTDESKIGLACAAYRSGAVELIDVSTGSIDGSTVSTVSSWLRGMRRAIVAIDAPLGWPTGLANSLNAHKAGQMITTDPNRMFRRETDRVIQETVKKTPLDVGADRIARTAHAALRLLGGLRSELKADVPLAWGTEFDGVTAIEVYPAATLKARGFRSQGYKKPDQVGERRQIVSSLGTTINLGNHNEAISLNSDVLDAVVCVLAARDFLSGECRGPIDDYLAHQEGWIWVRSPIREA